MLTRLVLVSVLLWLVGCGGAPAQTVTAQGVIEQFQAAGLSITNVQEAERDPESPLPNSYKERWEFTDSTLGDAGGQVFVCDTKKNCDALYAYFDALKALAGPYLYQSPDGRVVAQLNSGLAPDVAEKYQAVINGLP